MGKDRIKMNCVFKDVYGMNCQDCQLKGECQARASLEKEDRTSALGGYMIKEEVVEEIMI